ncbi:MAG: hypothetical protein ABEH56_05010 [Salinirussus sp.]
MAVTERNHGVHGRSQDWLGGIPFDETAFWGVWLLAVLTYGIGDIVTTVGIVWASPAYAEANPIVVWAVEAFGAVGFFGVKLLAFYAVLAASLWGGIGDEDALLFYGLPAVLALVGSFTTAVNLGLVYL